MSRRKSLLSNAKAGREDGNFFPLPLMMLQSPELAQLSPYAIKLLVDLLAQWRLGNNGYLSPSWALMQHRGWKSKATLANALKELEAGGWVIRTRQGGRNKATLYAVTFFRIEDHHTGKPLDVAATRRPTSEWRKAAPAPQKIAKPAPLAGANVLQLPSNAGQQAVA